MLAHGSAPITDNVEALIELGFTRSYPTAQRGYEATVWERAATFFGGYAKQGRRLGRCGAAAVA